MNRTERIRVALCFGLLAGILVLLAGRLAYLQVLERGSLMWEDGGSFVLNREAAENQRQRREPLPAPRGTIVDRQGRILAVDLPVMEVQAEVVFSDQQRRDPERLRALEQSLVRELAHVLASAPDRRSEPNLRNTLRQTLRSRIRRAGLDPDSDKEVDKRLFFLVTSELASVEVAEGLRALHKRIDGLYLHFRRGFKRFYPERDAPSMTA